jgi:hypothetical protein
MVDGQEERGCAAGCPFGTLGAELSEQNEGLRVELAQVFERWASQLDVLLYEARDELIEGTDTRGLAQFIIATLEGAMLMSRVQRRMTIMRSIAEQLKQYVGSRVRGRVMAAARPSA